MVPGSKSTGPPFFIRARHGADLFQLTSLSEQIDVQNEVIRKARTGRRLPVSGRFVLLVVGKPLGVSHVIYE